MFDVSEKLVVGQPDEIFGVSPLNWEDSSWRQLSLVNDEEFISLPHAKIYVFSDSVLCLGKVNQNPTSNTVWEEQLGWFKDSPHCSSSAKSKSSWPKWATHHNSKDELSSCRCSMTSYGDLKTMNGNAVPTPHLSLFLQNDSQQDVGHSSDLDQKRSGILLTLTNHEENGTESLN